MRTGEPRRCRLVAPGGFARSAHDGIMMASLERLMMPTASRIAHRRHPAQGLCRRAGPGGAAARTGARRAGRTAELDLNPAAQLDDAIVRQLEEIAGAGGK